MCIPCSNMCYCPSEYEDVNGTCVKDFFTIPDTPTIFTYNLHGRPYISNYLRDWVRLTAIKCKVGINCYIYALCLSTNVFSCVGTWWRKILRTSDQSLCPNGLQLRFSVSLLSLSTIIWRLQPFDILRR